MILTATEGDAGRVQITLYEGHGVDQKAVRHELTLHEIYRVHAACTEALYRHAKENEALRAEMEKLARAILPNVDSRGDGEHGRGVRYSSSGSSDGFPIL